MTTAWTEQVAAALDGVLAEGTEGAEGTETPYDEGFGPLTVTVPADRWTQALTVARDTLGCTFFDWLTAVDELEHGFSVVCHLASLGSSATARSDSPDVPQANRGVRHLLLRTSLPRESPTLASARGVFAGAGWHERETAEMFGIAFTDSSAVGGSDSPESAPTVLQMRHLLLPDEFEGHPLRKDFVLASRVVKPWPGAMEPGEGGEPGERGSPSRRRTRPPGVPEPEAGGPRAPGSAAPDPLAHARPGAARPRRRAAGDHDAPDATRPRAGRDRSAERGERQEQAPHQAQPPDQAQNSGQDSGEGAPDG
ncbi:MAG TPA: NADH-quinone oxidoreductase subunit C [Nocardioidaceae bacterium]|nr:NADH-quinone oxidoreductase subunit C [Nocardioidaceae bacterium]